VLGVEKKSALQLQDPRTVRKVALLDDHICIAFAGMLSSLAQRLSPNPPFICTSTGLTADGRILIDKARVECQSHRLTVEDPVSVEYITKFVAGVQQVSHPSPESPFMLTSMSPFRNTLNPVAPVHSVSQPSSSDSTPKTPHRACIRRNPVESIRHGKPTQ
jgi:hypothetical protein